MILGVTGISGAGKHTVGEYLSKRGWFIVDADQLAHRSYRPYTAVWKGIVREFGERILGANDVIDRQKLGKIVFNSTDPESADQALNKLNRIIHPYVKRRIMDEVHRKRRRKADAVVLTALWDAANLLEACDRIWLVQAPHKLCMERICKRDGISKETYLMRVRHQTEPDRPDEVIRNDEGVAELRKKVDEALSRL